MTQQMSYDEEGGVLTHVREGMTIYDAQDEEIGEVEIVYFGAAGAEGEHLGATPVTTAGVPGERRPLTWLDRLGNALELEPGLEMPEELAERLMRSGFIRVDSDRLLGADRFVLPDQIESVSEEGVRLNVNEEDLVREL